MVKHLLIICTGICLSFNTLAQSSILGEWLSEEKDGKIKVYMRGNKLYGKISWIKEPNDKNGNLKVDSENPDPAKRKTPRLNLEILKGFEYDKDDERWEDGTICDPTSGKTYDCALWLEGKNTLRIRGYWGFIFKTTTWTRAK